MQRALHDAARCMMASLIRHGAARPAVRSDPKGGGAILPLRSLSARANTTRGGWPRVVGAVGACTHMMYHIMGARNPRGEAVQHVWYTICG
jgi:hypothetical protein